MTGPVLAGKSAVADRSAVRQRPAPRVPTPQAMAQTPYRSVTEVRTFSVQRTPAAVLQRCGDHPCPPSGCSPKSDDQTSDLHRHEDSGAVPAGMADGVELARRVVSRAGDPLPPAVAGAMGRAMGVDLAGTRVHTDALAGESARSLGATAYSVGDHIVFGHGGYAPETSAGSRLLAHELTHVAQAGGPIGGAPSRAAFAAGEKVVGESTVSSPHDPAEHEASRAEDRVVAPAARVPLATIHRQAAGGHGSPALEESSSQLEGVYRRLGDNRRADAIRMCREQGGGACGVVLTQREVSALYALGKDAHGREAQVLQGLGTAAPSLALLGPVGGLGGTAGSTGTGFLGSGGLAGTAGGAGATATTATATTTTATTAAGATGAGIGVGTVAAVAGVTAIVAICVIAGIELWQMGQFQAELERRGFIILDDPLQVCIRGCHMGGPQRLPNLNDRFPPLTLENLPQWMGPVGGQRTGPDTRRDPVPGTQPQPRPVPRPLPDSDTDEEERGGCRGFATFQRGGNSCHDRFATAISGVPREWEVVTPERRDASFDARDPDRVTLWEVKTGYGWLNRTDLTPAQQRWRAATADRWSRQAAHQQMVANRCGYSLRWAFTSEEARQFAEHLVQADTVTFRFSCSEDSERGI